METTPERSELMSRVRQSGTKPEEAVRGIVNHLGYGYETNVCSLPGSPDLADIKQRWAIFVHGCFWHVHKGCKRSNVPKHNRGFWTRKFSDNVARDLRKVAALKAQNVAVLVVWECELSNEERLSRKIRRFLEKAAVQQSSSGT